MASSDCLAPSRLSVADIEAGLRLSDEAGWNQIAADWRLFIESGETIGIRDSAGQLVATAAALPYEEHFGFVAMVLVTASWRRKGLATALLNRCVGHLQERAMVPVLDATPAGALVYRQQGFVDLFGLERWQLARSGPESSSEEPVAVREAHAQDQDCIVALDALAAGAARSFLVKDFMAREGTRTFVAESGNGFAVLRRGRRADQIGPVVAQTPAEALQLISTAFAAVKGAVYIDVPSIWKDIRQWLAARGFSIQRSFSRMALGRSLPFGRPERLFAVAGPEFG